jgi:uncharacterized protein YodC (DUF2158 family)
MNMDFSPGDLVRLKSGGPTMTVEQVGTKAYTEEAAVWCVWFEKVGNKQVVQRDTFTPTVLEKCGKTPSVARLVVA